MTEVDTDSKEEKEVDGSPPKRAHPKENSISLSYGVMMITHPSVIHPDEMESIEKYFELVVKQMRRRVITDIVELERYDRGAKL